MYIDKDTFYRLYITENKTRKEIAEILHVNASTIQRLSKKFIIYKTDFPNYAPWNKGVKMSEEQKLKISQTKRNKSKEEKDAVEAKRGLSRGLYVSAVWK